MAVKITLGNRPKTFIKAVTFPMLDGTTGSIEVAYKYRTKKEFGLFIDDLMTAAGVTTRDPDEKFSMAALMEKTTDSNADYVLKVIESWNIDTPLSRAAVQQLSDEIPAACIAIMETYRLATTEGRLGN